MKEKYCSTCGQDLKAGELSVRCRLCMRNYHAYCWEKAGGCTTFGCAGKPALEKDEKGSIYKRCPSCGEKVIDFAVRCRYCRAVIDEEAASKSGQNTEPPEKPFRKDPILTGMLNLIFPGAGYMYLGQFNKGFAWFLIAVFAWFFTRYFGLLAVYLWVMYDSARQALSYNRGGPPPTKTTAQRR